MPDTSNQKKFQEEFKAKEYLKNYYSKVNLAMVRKYVLQKDASSETMRIMMFLDIVCSPLLKAIFGKEKATLLELGGGPTLYQLMNIAEDVKEIHFTDYVEDNLREIRNWKKKSSNAFNWRIYLKTALMIKNDTVNIGDKEIKKLENTLRKKITEIHHCDIFKNDLGVPKKSYDVINTHFVAESATSSKSQWRKAIKNIHNKLNKGGLLFMSALRGAKGNYKVLNKNFPAVELYEKDLRSTLKNTGFDTIRLSSIVTEDTSNNYNGFIFAVARKK